MPPFFPLQLPKVPWPGMVCPPTVPAPGPPPWPRDAAAAGRSKVGSFGCGSEQQNMTRGANIHLDHVLLSRSAAFCPTSRVAGKHPAAPGSGSGSLCPPARVVFIYLTLLSFHYAVYLFNGAENASVSWRRFTDLLTAS